MMFQIQGGCFGYGEHMLLDHISIEADSGEILAILGPNGVGKTTLLKCMMGLLSWKKGKTLLDGRDLGKMNPRAVWKKLAYVPQAKGSPLPYTAEDMVVLGRSAHLGMLSQPGEMEYKKAERAMEQVGILSLRGKLCSQMSGGELQMVLIARALAAEPEILILDEPESNLDFKNQLIILETMRRLAREDQLCCIFNTHYPDHALKIADRALLLDKNGSSTFGRCVEVVNRENMRRSFEVNVEINRMTAGGSEILSVVPLSLAEPV